jgi:phospholipid/cholesterol/gamma-HCH transport system substrate-binding protein
VQARLQIDHGVHIPSDTKAIVMNLSAVGEQYLDLQPAKDQGPYLHAGSVIPASRSATPIGDATLLRNLERLVTSVNLNKLDTFINQLGIAFRDVGPDLQRLITYGDALTKSALETLPQQIRLINDGRTVLNTQIATSSELQTFANDLGQFARTNAAINPDYLRLFHTGQASSQQLSDLVNANRSILPTFLANLVTLNAIQAARIPALKSLLVLYPLNVVNGFLTSSPIPGVSSTGVAHFALVVTPQNNKNPCLTYRNSPSGAGYIPPGAQRDNTYTSNFGGPAYLNTYCNERPSQNQSDVRGARAAPRPPGDTTANPPPGGYRQQGPASDYGVQPPPGSDYMHGDPYGRSSGSGGSGSRSANAASAPLPAAGQPTASPSPVYLVPYDPRSGMFTAPNGQRYQLGSTGGEQQVFGTRSWAWLLLEPLVG